VDDERFLLWSNLNSDDSAEVFAFRLLAQGSDLMRRESKLDVEHGEPYLEGFSARLETALGGPRGLVADDDLLSTSRFEGL
jgi:hypothetical protein